MAAMPDGLSHEVMEQRVTDALGVTLADFAQNPDARFSVERKAWQALRAVVGNRLSWIWSAAGPARRP